MMDLKSRGLRRIGAAMVALLLGVLLLEGLLQVAALLLSKDRSLAWSASLGDRRILTIGDSNTYGLYVDEGESYPDQLEALWNARFPDEPLSVANAGYPGNNSSHALRDLSVLLDEVRPDLLIVMIGVNDFWTLPAEDDASSPDPIDVWGWLKRHSRLFRLAYAALGAANVSWEKDFNRGFELMQGRLRIGEREIDASWARDPAPRGAPERRQHLTRIAEQAEKHGVRVLFMTYPAQLPPYSAANEDLRAAAKATGQLLVDQEAHFRRLCSKPRCQELLYADQHPQAEGYQIMAEEIALALRENPR